MVTDDALFLIGTGLGHVRVVGLDQDRRRVELEDAGLSVCPRMAAMWIC